MTINELERNKRINTLFSTDNKTKRTMKIEKKIKKFIKGIITEIAADNEYLQISESVLTIGHDGCKVYRDDSFDINLKDVYLTEKLNKTVCQVYWSAKISYYTGRFNLWISVGNGNFPVKSFDHSFIIDECTTMKKQFFGLREVEVLDMDKIMSKIYSFKKQIEEIIGFVLEDKQVL